MGDPQSRALSEGSRSPPCCTRSCATRRCPARASTRRRSGAASSRSSPTSCPRNRELLARRDELQRQLDEWHTAHPGPVADQAAYLQLLRDLGYLVEEPADFAIETEGVDDEVAVQAGPQLVVPCSTRGSRPTRPTRAGARSTTRSTAPTPSPRTTAQERGSSYNPKRGAAVIATARAFLDEHFPLESGHPRRRDRLLHRGRRAGGRARRRPSQRAGRPGAVRRPPRRPGRPRGRAAGPPRAARRDPGRPRRLDRQGRRGRGEGPAARGRGLHDHGPRGLRRRRRRRRQGRGLPQLAPAQPGHADRRGRQGRPVRHVHPRARARTGSTTDRAARSCCRGARCCSCARSAT